ncbi:hypothetical protein LGN19_30355 [Burkholderia sp. AU30198]|uniref:hypothetical protein n=1 Tax=Burkholderia TaxID=32008 RepID=UPI001582FCB8|nr:MULTISPECIES: hypothetical protein [Burkholderia]MCA8298101.1 hypothetical protein [Burkholderia sp. AU30198]
MERDVAQVFRAIHLEQGRHAQESVPGRDAARKHATPGARRHPLRGLRSAR